MKAIAEGRYGGLVRLNETDVIYIPTAQSHQVTVSFATEENDPALRRRNAPETLLFSDMTVNVDSADIGSIEGTIRFSDGKLNPVSRAKHWLVLEDAVGPLRYRSDVENASFHNSSGKTRPRVPIQVTRYGNGAVFAYFIAHDHYGYRVSRELPGTLSDLNTEFETFVEQQAPSFVSTTDLWPK